MNNYDAVSYARVALRQLEKEGKKIDEDTLKGRMLYLMDVHSESSICNKCEEGK